ncbi:hypothetical protein KAU39_07390, partial [bacterium]|nr:hypothetical protein [bacterium]
MQKIVRQIVSMFVFCSCLVSIARAKPDFTLFDSGSEIVVDYARYGTFEGIGSDNKYKYVIKDKKGLAGAVGEGIYPNDKTVLKDPQYQKFLSEGKLEGSQWSFLGSNAQANFYRWAMAPESPAVKLFYIAQ